MANTSSAKKAVRQIGRRLVAGGDGFLDLADAGAHMGAARLVDLGAAGEAAFKLAQPELMRSAQKGIVHKNTASRKVSRLSHRISAMGA